MTKNYPCDVFKDENGMSYCPYADSYVGYTDEMCRNCCGLGVDDDSYDYDNDYDSEDDSYDCFYDNSAALEGKEGKPKMTIVREINGVGMVFELTDAEIREATDFYDRLHYKEDIDTQWEREYDGECPYSDEEKDDIIYNFLDNLGMNDSYWQSYWDSMSYAIRQYDSDHGINA